MKQLTIRAAVLFVVVICFVWLSAAPHLSSNCGSGCDNKCILSAHWIDLENSVGYLMLDGATVTWAPTCVKNGSGEAAGTAQSTRYETYAKFSPQCTSTHTPKRVTIGDGFDSIFGNADKADMYRSCSTPQSQKK